jgi:hypothetical protein
VFEHVDHETNMHMDEFLIQQGDQLGQSTRTKRECILLCYEASTQNRVIDDVPTIRGSRKVHKLLDKFVTKIIVEHQVKRQDAQMLEGEKDMVDVMLDDYEAQTCSD